MVVFVVFGEIVESSNKMYLEIGSYFGFVIIWYCDLWWFGWLCLVMDVVWRVVCIKGLKVDVDLVKVEYDLEGCKSW